MAGQLEEGSWRGGSRRGRGRGTLGGSAERAGRLCAAPLLFCCSWTWKLQSLMSSSARAAREGVCFKARARLDGGGCLEPQKTCRRLL